MLSMVDGMGKRFDAMQVAHTRTVHMVAAQRSAENINSIDEPLNDMRRSES